MKVHHLIAHVTKHWRPFFDSILNSSINTLACGSLENLSHEVLNSVRDGIFESALEDDDVFDSLLDRRFYLMVY